MNERKIDQLDIIDLVNCAEDYGHWNDVCMWSLYEFAKPVSDEDIKAYSESLKDEDGYGEEDREGAIDRITEWRDKHVNAEINKQQ